MKRIWLGQWLRNGELEMPGTGIGDCELESLDDPKDRKTTQITKKQLDNAYATMKTNYGVQTKKWTDAGYFAPEAKESLERAVTVAQTNLTAAQSSQETIGYEEALAAARKSLQEAETRQKTQLKGIAQCESAKAEWEQSFKGM